MPERITINPNICYGKPVAKGTRISIQTALALLAAGDSTLDCGDPASVARGNLRLLLSGERSSDRQPLADGTRPVPGGWNRILLEVPDLKAEVARLRAAGVKFRREDILSGPGGSQIWVVDPCGNLVELFQAR